MATKPTSQQQTAQAQQIAQNRQFMRLSYSQPVLANAQNGTSYTVGGNPLNFLAPVTELAYAEKITIRTSLNVNYTPNATSPTATLNAAAPWNAIGNVEVLFGNTQINVNPFFEIEAAKMRGLYRAFPGQNLGDQVANVQSQIYKSPTLASGANTWEFDIDVPLNRIHPQSVWGLIPIMGTGTRLQVNVTPATAFVGNDPLQNVVSSNGQFSVAGSVQVIVWYRDYKSMATRNPISPNLAGIPTIQVVKPQEVNPLTAGSWNYKRIDNPYEVARVISVVIDGNSSSTFASASNIAGFSIDRAENSSSNLRKFDNTNGGMINYYRQAREQFGQDLSEGVLAIDTLTQNVASPDTMNGDAYLNLTSAGFPAARLGYMVNSVGSLSGVTPRVVSYLTIINRQGISITG